MPAFWEKYAPYKDIEFKPLARDTSSHGAAYADCIGAFDIETSRYKEIEQAAMYVWQFCLDFPDGHDVVIFGRTWQEFTHCLFALKQRLKGMRLQVFIHNASYEFQFLSGIYDFTDNEVFILEGRSILYFKMYRAFEFRCSYKLFNMSLSEATAKYCSDYHKKEGSDFGYEERRFSDTPLTRKQLLYCLYDVWGCCKAVRAIMALFNDNSYSIPYTATGYVRREAKAAMQEYYPVIKQSWPDYEVFQLLRFAFRGGNTHCNRFFAGDIVKNVKGRDISSSYPTQECLERYPMTPFKKRDLLSESGIDYYMENGAACLIHAVLRCVGLRDPFEAIPYLPLAKCVQYPEGVKLDNGRILECSRCEVVITDVDYKILRRQYHFNIIVLDLYTSWYDDLPLPIRDLNRKYYRDKTALKGLAGQGLYYMKAKNLLNAIYGDFVMNPVRLRILYAHGEFLEDHSKPDAAILETAGKHPYKLYQWGVWVCAHARAQLQAGLDLVGSDNVVYCDTDSVKYIGSADWTDYNAQRMQRAIDAGCYADDKNGRRFYMGTFDDDENYSRFRSWGAKKYAYETEEGDLHITVAGVPKKDGAVELSKKGGLDVFKPGFVFSDINKLEAVYNDENIGRTRIDGRMVNITKNIVLRPTTYSLSITDEYSALLDNSVEMLTLRGKI